MADYRSPGYVLPDEYLDEQEAARLNGGGGTPGGAPGTLPVAGSQGGAMPWEVRDDHPDCTGYGVVDDAGSLVDGGCHDRKADAVRHQRALYANTSEEEASAVTQTAAEPAAGRKPPRPGMRDCPPGTKQTDTGDCVALEDLALDGEHLDAHLSGFAGKVDNTTWDADAAMGACNTGACFRAICAGRRSGPAEARATWALPHHKTPDSAPNANGVRNALARFSATQGLTNGQEARSHLERHMAAIRGAAEAAGLSRGQLDAWVAGHGGEELDRLVEAAFGGDPNPGTKPDKRLADNKPKPRRKRRTTAATDSKIEVTGDGAWEGILVIEGIPTGDGREFAPDSLSFADFPLPLTYQPPTHGGEPGPAVDVGRIDEAWRDENDTRILRGRGVFDLKDPAGADVYRKVQERFLKGMSVDVDDIDPFTDVELVWPEDVTEEDLPVAQLFLPPQKRIFHKGRVRGAAVLSMPAFVEAQLWTDGAGPELPDLDAAEAAARTTDEGDDAVTAAAGTVEDLDDYRPPAEWFQDPKLGQRCPIVVTSEGQVYGHAARWGDCHIGYGNGECVTVPREEDFPYFAIGEVVCAGGERIPVGAITLNTGHAAKAGLSWRQAQAHYDDTGTVVADVAIGADQVGIWVAGAVRPGATAQQVYALRASGKVSGDWRFIGGRLRLVGLLGVNVPGFPVPRPEARVAGGQVVALTAAGMLDVGGADLRLQEEELDQRALRLLMQRTLDGVLTTTSTSASEE